jgi:hypothetical protein
MTPNQFLLLGQWGQTRLIAPHPRGTPDCANRHPFLQGLAVNPSLETRRPPPCGRRPRQFPPMTPYTGEIATDALCNICRLVPRKRCQGTP